MARDRYPDLSDALLYLEHEGYQVTIEDSLGIPLNPLARMHEFYSGLDPLRAARVMARSRRYDAIVSVGCSSALFLVRLRRVLDVRVPVVLIDPALSRDYPRRKRLQDVVLPRVEKVVVYGRVQLDYLREEYGDLVDSKFLYHRADTDFYNPALSNATLGGSDRMILSVGTDISRDFDTLVNAVCLSGVVEDFDARCIIRTSLPIASPGPGIEHHREMISYVDLRRLYQRASLFVLPLKDSIHAGGINSLLEAMSMARPIVVTRSRGIVDYVEHKKSALVVEPGDAVGMARAIRHLLENPDEARLLGENARRFVIERCRNAVYAQALGVVLREVIRVGGRKDGSRREVRSAVTSPGR
jgi:glycosyltransferase involved in cell wall biosynthesis